MPSIKSKHQLATDAEILATSYACIRHRQVTYIPADYETGDDSVTPEPHRTIWVPLTRPLLQAKAFTQFQTLFESEAQLSSFEFMVAQSSINIDTQARSLLIRTEDGLKELREDGLMYPPTGVFIPNTLKPTLNENPADKQELLETLVNWVDSEEEALAMLRHFATSLVPSWSAVKYVLLLGAGRNGKSLLMHMLTRLFGSENCSNISRQDISDKSPVITGLNGKLLNIVYDGMATYLKDSGFEKSLIAGETVQVRRLYSSDHTPVQTNALFIEGLNREPKSSDKSTALQARLIRFWFPNVYPEDRDFWNHMTSDRMVGALLSLMIDNYVKPNDATTMLAPTAASIELQLEHMYENSAALQFIKYLEDTHPLGSEVLIDMDIAELTSLFSTWRLKELNDLRAWTEPEVTAAFRPVVITSRKSKRVNGSPRKVRYIAGFTKETTLFISSMKEEEESDEDTTVVVAE